MEGTFLVSSLCICACCRRSSSCGLCPQTCCCCLATKSHLTLLCPVSCSLALRPCPWAFPGKNTWVACHFLPQGIVPIRGWICISWTGEWMVYHWATRVPAFLTLRSPKTSRNHRECVINVKRYISSDLTLYWIPAPPWNQGILWQAVQFLSVTCVSEANFLRP